MQSGLITESALITGSSEATMEVGAMLSKVTRVFNNYSWIIPMMILLLVTTTFYREGVSFFDDPIGSIAETLTLFI